MSTAAGTAPPTPGNDRERPGATRRRDPFIDVLRVGAVLVIVVQHWLLPELSYESGDLVIDSGLALPGTWMFAWLGQMVPLIFFAGGAAATYSLRRRASSTTHPAPHGGWLPGRLRRLAMPVMPLLLVGLTLPHLLVALGVPVGAVHTAARLASQPLWFLAAYLLVTALAPMLVRLHHACRGIEVAALAAAAIVVDILRFGWFDGAFVLGYANVVLVWAAAYQLGIVYASGGLRLRPSSALGMAAAGLAGTGAAVLLGPPPGSMSALPGELTSATTPPAAVLLGLAMVQLGLALALRPVIMAWMLNRPVARSIGWLSARLMTIYIWHLPALFAVATVAVVGLGWTTPPLLGADWRQAMPIWLGSLVVVLAVLVRLFGRFEHLSHPATARGSRASGAVPRPRRGPSIRPRLGIAPPPKVQLAGSPARPERERVEV